MSDATHLFVYGTLLTAADHPVGAELRSGATCVGRGWIRACLYQVQDPREAGYQYPGAVPSGYDHDRVHGELYALHDPDQVLATCDIYEACDPSRPEPHEYQRRPVPVTLQDGRVIRALSYFYAWDLSRATRLHSGRFEDVAAYGTAPIPRARW